MALEIHTANGPFGSTFPRFRIGNAYTRPVNSPFRSFSQETSLPNLDFHYLVAGNFNIHSPAAGPFRVLSPNEETESAPFFTRASDIGFYLLNTPGTYTCFLFSGSHTPSAIDLAFANPHMLPAFRYWDATSLPSTGSHYVPILICLQPPIPPSKQSRLHWQDADWPFLTDKLKDWQIPPTPRSPFPKQLDLWFSSALNVLTCTIEASTPHACPSSKSKLW